MDNKGHDGLSYVVRMHFYAQVPLVRIDYTFVQDTKDIFVDVPFVDLALPLQADQAYHALFGAEPGKEVAFQAGPGDTAHLTQLGPDQKESIAKPDYEPFRKILQERRRWCSEEERRLWEGGPARTEFSYEIAHNGAAIARGERAPGWVRLEPKGKHWALTVGMRWFWQNHPKAIALDDGALHVYAYPPHAGEPLHLHIGTAKTHSVFLYLNAPGLHAQPADIATAFNAPPLYYPSPQWHCASGLWGSIVPLQPGKFRLFEARAAQTIRSDFLGRRETRNGYGMLNFGDIPWGSNTWANMETAYDHGVFVHFIRTGVRTYFDLFEQAVWHFRDVDVNHTDVEGLDWGLWLMPGYVPEGLARECAQNEKLRNEVFYWTGTQPPGKGAVRRHSFRHFGNITARHPVPLDSRYEHKRGKCYSGSCGVGGHGWIVGLVDHYLATGDRRSLEVAELAGEWVLKREHVGWGRDNWKHIDLMALYRATGKRQYLDAVKRAIDHIHEHRGEVVQRLREQQRTLMSPYYTILRFVREYHQATGEQAVARKYVELIDPWFENMRFTESGLGEAFDYIRDYRDSRCHSDFADLAYAFGLTGNRRYIDRSLTSFRLYMHFAYHSTCLFGVPEYLSALDKLGIDPLDEAQPAMHRSTRVFWRDKTDEPARVWVHQQAGYRVPAKPHTGSIRVTAPDGSVAMERALTMGGLDVYELAVPPDGKRGVYQLDAQAPGVWFTYAGTTPNGDLELGARPPEIVPARSGTGVLLKDGATVALSAQGHLDPSQGTIEICFSPLCRSPAERAADVPYHYHYLFDSRNQEYDFGFQVFLWDSGKRGAGKSLIAGWGDYNKGDSLSVEVRWPAKQWHHVAFAWHKPEDAKATGKLYLDGKLVASRSDMVAFPSRMHDTITLGANSPRTGNSHLNCVIDWLRISNVMRESFPDREPKRDANTLLLRGFDSVE